MCDRLYCLHERRIENEILDLQLATFQENYVKKYNKYLTS